MLRPTKTEEQTGSREVATSEVRSKESLIAARPRTRTRSISQHSDGQGPAVAWPPHSPADGSDMKYCGGMLGPNASRHRPYSLGPWVSSTSEPLGGVNVGGGGMVILGCTPGVGRTTPFSQQPRQPALALVMRSLKKRKISRPEGPDVLFKTTCGSSGAEPILVGRSWP